VPLNLSFTHLMVVLIVALVVLGPDKLPEAARTMAKGIREFRRMTGELKTEVRESFPEITEPLSDLRNAVTGMPSVSRPSNGNSAPQVPAPPLNELPSLGGQGPQQGTFLARPDDGPQ
jgi:sec-independent protein translocase protein TatB